MVQKKGSKNGPKNSPVHILPYAEVDLIFSQREYYFLSLWRFLNKSDVENLD